jgi:hypothetical protein
MTDLVWVLLLLGTSDAVVIEQFLPFLGHTRVWNVSQVCWHNDGDLHCPVLQSKPTCVR